VINLTKPDNSAIRRHFRHFVLAITCLITLVTNGDAAPVAASAQTSSTDKLFPVVETTLTNGLHLLVQENHNCPVIAVQVWYHVGGADEPTGRRGFAHLFEHMMFRGTDRLGPTAHFDLLQSVGGNCNAFTSFDETCYHETLPAAQLELALWLEAERMAFLTVDTAGFNTERKVVEEERRLGLNAPYGDLPDRALPTFFGSHPYANNPIGTIRDLRLATPGDVHAWWSKWYVPNNATLVIVGDIQADRVRTLVQKYFGWIPPVPIPARNLSTPGPFPSAKKLVLEAENAPVPAVGIVWRTVPEGHPDALALDVISTILGGDEGSLLGGALMGGSDSSRLYRRLVVQDHLAVVAKAGQFQLSKAGAFAAGAALLPIGGDADRTLSALKEEMVRLLKDGITDEELAKARNQVMSGLLLGAQTVGEQASLIGRAAVVGRGTEELNSRVERLRKLTSADVKRIAVEWLDPKHAMTITVPGSGLWKQIGRLFNSGRKGEEEAAPVVAPETVLRGRPGVVRPEDLPVRPPIKDETPAIPSPVVSERHLTNGLRLLLAPNLHTPAVGIVLALPYGTWSEQKPGAAAMALGMLTKGTETHGENALAEELDRHAIRISTFATHDDSRVEATCLLEQADEALSLLAEVSLHPAFPEGSLNTMVKQAQSELNLSDGSPAAVAEREFRRHLFAGHPYARRVSGEAVDLSALRREDLSTYWRASFRPDKATLIIAGALEPKRAFELVEKYFGSWQPSATAGTNQAFSLRTLDKTQIYLVDWPGAGQSEIRVGCYGITTRDADTAVADLVSSYFGGSFGGRLMKKIRVESGATYGVHGGFRPNRMAGEFVVSTFTKTSSTAETLKLVLEQVRALIEQAPTSEELSLHRRYFSGSAAAKFETPEQVGSYLARVSLSDLPLDNIRRSLTEIANADAPKCEALVRKSVDPDHLVIVVVGDAGAIGESLKDIAPVTRLDRSGKEL
jgi:zinc protease